MANLWRLNPKRMAGETTAYTVYERRRGGGGSGDFDN
jgi:hypothetical protein